MENTPNTTAIIVTYNSEHVVGDCLKALLTAPELGQLVVIDNCSLDDTLELLARDFPAVKIVENPKNEGLARAINTGLKHAQTPYALVVDPAAVLRQGAVPALLAAAGSNPNAAILAAHVAGAQPYDQQGLTSLTDEEVPTAAWLLNMKLLQKPGYFDKELFDDYTHDEMRLRLNKAGLEVIIVQEAVATLQAVPAKTLKRESQYEAQKRLLWAYLYVVAKHHGQKAADALGWKLQLRYSIEAAVHTVMFQREKVNHYRGRIHGIVTFATKRKP